MCGGGQVHIFELSDLVILKIRSKRTQRSTEMPSGDMILVSTRMVSRIPPQTTKLSKRLKSETKYACGGGWGVGGGNPISMTFFSVSIQFTRPVLYLKAQAVHLQEHLTGEECEQHLVGYV